MDTQKLKELAISETGLIFEPSTGYIFTSNPMGVLLITSLREGKNLDEIKEFITETYDAREDVVEKDIFDFVNQLINCGLVKDI